MKRSPLPLAAAGLATLALAGCASTTTVRNGGTLQVAVTEYRITPQDVDARGGALTIVVHNDGRLSHNLVISHGSVVEASTPPIAPGQWTEMETVLPAGHYVMSSWLQSDQALGAYGSMNIGR